MRDLEKALFADEYGPRIDEWKKTADGKKAMEKTLAAFKLKEKKIRAQRKIAYELFHVVSTPLAPTDALIKSISLALRSLLNRYSAQCTRTRPRLGLTDMPSFSPFCGPILSSG